MKSPIIALLLGVTIWTSFASGKPFTDHDRGHGRAITSLESSLDGTLVVSSSMDGFTVIRNLLGEPLLSVGDKSDAVSSVVMAPDKSWFAYGTYNGAIRVHALNGREIAKLEVSGGKPGTHFKEQRQKILDLAISPDSGLLAACTPDGSLLLFETAEWTLHDRNNAGDVVGALAFDPRGETLAGGTWSGNIRRYLLDEKSFGQDWAGLGHAITDLAFCKDGKRLVGATAEGMVLWWEEGEVISKRKVTDSSIEALDIGKDHLALGGMDNTARLLCPSDLTEKLVIKGFNDNIRALAFIPGTSLLFIATDRGALWSFDYEHHALARLGGERELSTDVIFENSERIESMPSDS